MMATRNAVPGGGAQNSNQISQKCRTNTEEFKQNSEEFRPD